MTKTLKQKMEKTQKRISEANFMILEKRVFSMEMILSLLVRICSYWRHNLFWLTFTKYSLDTHYQILISRSLRCNWSRWVQQKVFCSHRGTMGFNWIFEMVEGWLRRNVFVDSYSFIYPSYHHPLIVFQLSVANNFDLLAYVNVMKTKPLISKSKVSFILYP